VLGNQRTAALRVGLLGAYAGRGIMLLLASLIVHHPLVENPGRYLPHPAGVLKTWAWQRRATTMRTSAKSKPPHFGGVVLTVEIADLVFSLDKLWQPFRSG